MNFWCLWLKTNNYGLQCRILDNKYELNYDDMGRETFRVFELVLMVLIEGFLLGDQEFEKVSNQVYCLYPKLYLNEVNHFKVVIDICLVEETGPEVDQNIGFEVETTPSSEEKKQTEEIFIENSYEVVPNNYNFWLLFILLS